MYIEIHDFKDIEQEALYFKINSAFSLKNKSGKTTKIKGIYAIFNNNVCLYVGQSKNLASRIATHLRGKYKKCDFIIVLDIKHIGFDDFDKRPIEAQSNILINAEKYIMEILKPIDNINIDMDFKLDKEKIPLITTDRLTIEIDNIEPILKIYDKETDVLEQAYIDTTLLHLNKQINNETLDLLTNILKVERTDTDIINELIAKSEADNE